MIDESGYDICLEIDGGVKVDTGSPRVAWATSTMSA